MSHMMLELSTAHLSSRTLDALSENSIETVASYEKASRWLGRVGYFIAITGLEEDLPANSVSNLPNSAELTGLCLTTMRRQWQRFRSTTE